LIRFSSFYSLAVFNYLADAYLIYASSALAAQSFLRNLLDGTFPPWVVPCYKSLGINWASTLFGCLASVLAAVPVFAFWFGPRIRARSKFSKKLLADEERLKQLKDVAMAKKKGDLDEKVLPMYSFNLNDTLHPNLLSDIHS
jgi:hypothetical protein